MTARSDKGNSGIQMGGGNLTANNLAVGDGASIRTGDAVQALDPVDLAALRQLLAGSRLPDPDKADALQAVAEIEEEAAKDTPDPSRIETALARLTQLGKASAALIPLADKLAPLIRRIAMTLLA